MRIDLRRFIIGVLQDYGYTGSQANIARIIAVHKGRYDIICEQGERSAVLKSSEYYNKSKSFPTVGDFVEIVFNPSGDSLIVDTLKRKSIIKRNDPSAYGIKLQFLASNVDNCFVLTSANYDFNFKRLERYMTTILESKTKPIIVITKIDMVTTWQDMVNTVKEMFPNILVLAVSNISGYGIDSIRALLTPGSTNVFLGSSGVGKSSLLNSAFGAEVMSTGGIRINDSKGRHTTTYRQLVRLDNGAMIIDTPGIRVLGVWGDEESVNETFSDIAELESHCHFHDCTHTNEPKCAILQALADGTLDKKRWKRYNTLKNEAKRSQKAEKMFIAEDRGKKARIKKSIAKEVRKEKR